MHLTLLYLKLVATSALGALIASALVDEVLVFRRLARRAAAARQLETRLVQAARQARAPAASLAAAVVAAVRQPLAAAARPLAEAAGQRKVVTRQHHARRVCVATRALRLFLELVERTRRAALLRRAAALRAHPECTGDRVGAVRRQRLLARRTVRAAGADDQCHQLLGEVRLFQLDVHYESLLFANLIHAIKTWLARHRACLGVRDRLRHALAHATRLARNHEICIDRFQGAVARHFAHFVWHYPPARSESRRTRPAQAPRETFQAPLDTHELVDLCLGIQHDGKIVFMVGQDILGLVLRQERAGRTWFAER